MGQKQPTAKTESSSTFRSYQIAKTTAAGEERKVGKPNWERDFPVVGQGTLIFSARCCLPFSIVIRPELKDCEPGGDQWISLEVLENQARFKIGKGGTSRVLARVNDVVKNELVGYEPGRKISYWFSYDRDRLVLKYGKGYRMDETTLMTFDFLHPRGKPVADPEKVRKNFQYLFCPTIRRHIEHHYIVNEQEIPTGKDSLKRAALQQTPALVNTVDGKKCCIVESLLDTEREVVFDNTPFVCNWPPHILDSSKVSLLELDRGKYTLSASLPPACQELYKNVSAEHVMLDFPQSQDGLNLSDAIRYSMTTEGMFLHRKLQEKKWEFGPENEVYLRVTLGPNRGCSPGVPYVLEIWPKGCGSPIHNHGNSYAVIKVLHGGLTMSIFNKHSDTRDALPVTTFDVSEGDVTWISPNWYQTHKLWNYTNDYCATIQCYMFGSDDTVQWPYFDYIASTNAIDEFLPNSDVTFGEMREKVLAEYKEHVHAIGQKHHQ
jgi:hypothetical protein